MEDVLPIEMPNPVYKHLTDHDYLSSKPKSRKETKKQQRQIKITELKALFNCMLCGYRTMDRDVLQKHICIKTLELILKNPPKLGSLPKGYEQCKSCNITEKTIVQRKRTYIKPDLGPISSNHQCSKCNYSSQNKTGLKIHMHVHDRGSLYKCTECSYLGTDLKDLIKHYGEVKDLRCQCGYATHVKHQMIGHIRSHTGEKPYCCAVCNFATSDRPGLHRHMKKHVVK